jgi:subfamily B ATP-binding cassette protein MsbA
MSSVFIGIGILFIGGVHILEEGSDFSFGDFTAFLFAIFSMMKPLKSITGDFADVRRTLVSVDRVSEILELKSEIKEIDNPVIKTDFTDKIEFKNVSFSYNADAVVLKDCSFEIKKGQKVAFVGSSGSGKTTIANLINRMYDASAGEVMVDGINVKELKINDLRKLFGIVTQESILFSDTIENNIKYGSNSDKTIDDVKLACHFAYADEFIDKLPEKYQTMVFPRGSNLSGGQKQRLCIARAIIDNPPILIFDEATSALDTDSEQKVQKAIDMAAGNRTVIIIAHRLSTIMSADKIFVLDNGVVVGAGTHDELMKTCERYRQWF